MPTDDAAGRAAAGQQPGLALTGERTLPGIAHENYWFRRHEVAYRWVTPWCAGARVVDAGCGEGYGAALVAAVASEVVAVDYAPEVVAHVRRTYPAIAAVRGDLQRLPVGEGRAEVVVTLQTVEHLHDQPGFVAECARVLRPSGTLVVTTPNRLTFSPGRDTPLNPFHTRELSPAELADLLAPHFTVTRMLGIGHGTRIRRWERRHGPLTDALLAAPPERWPRHVARLVRTITVGDFAVDADDVDGSLDLLAVATKR